MQRWMACCQSCGPCHVYVQMAAWVMSAMRHQWSTGKLSKTPFIYGDCFCCWEIYCTHLYTKRTSWLSVVVSVTGSSLAIDPQCPNNGVRWSLESPFANLARCSPFSMGRRWITDAKERNRFTNGRVATSRLPMSSRSSLGHTCFTQHEYIFIYVYTYIHIPPKKLDSVIYIYRCVCVCWLFTPGECSPFQLDLIIQELNEVAMAMDDPRQCARCGVFSPSS